MGERRVEDGAAGEGDALFEACALLVEMRQHQGAQLFLERLRHDLAAALFEELRGAFEEREFLGEGLRLDVGEGRCKR